MEEILNPEVEVQDVAPVAEVEVAPATVEEVAVVAAEKETKKAQPATKQEVIARLKEIALDASNAERAEIDLLKQIVCINDGVLSGIFAFDRDTSTTVF